MFRRQADDRRSEAGFTLVEVMTVVFIIGLTSGLVLLTMPERAPPSERVADAFARDVRQASDRAILTGRVQAIDLVEDGYRPVEWRDDSWVSLARPRGLSRRGLRLTLRDGQRVDDEEELLPELVFDPTGVNDPVELEFRMDGDRFILNIAADGEVRREAR